jgi:uncharacterized protein
MKTINRFLNLKALLKDKSFFLFGARATGKSYLINQQLKKEALVIDLLNSDYFLKLSQNPSELENIISFYKEKKIIVIDEVQKLPELLSEVHRLIEKNKQIKFLLTGSSARKLKYGKADMLAGRAWSSYLFPLTYNEIPNFNLDRYLRYGGLPFVYLSTKPEEELNAYVNTYIKEEIQAEALVRKISSFSRFLKTASLTNTNMLKFAELASDTAIPASTIREFYFILEDTLIGFMLPAWTKSKKRKAIQTSKFYFFDTGLTHKLLNTTSLDRNSNLYGNSFEQFIAMELRAYIAYKRLQTELSYWRSTHGFEVDFILNDEIAIEVKASKRINKNDLKGLFALEEENMIKYYYLVSQDKIEAKERNIIIIYWETFLKKLWNDEIF